MAMKDPMPLLSQLFDGSLSEEQAKELCANIKNDPKYAEEVLLAAFLHSNLRDLLNGRGDLGELPSSVSGLGDAHILPALKEGEEGPREMVKPEALPFVVLKKVKSSPKNLMKTSDGLRFPIRGMLRLAVAAMVLIAAGFGVWFLLSRSKSEAVVSDIVDAQWQTPLQVGDSLPKGIVTLKSGLARVAFGAGASVVLQGPATLQVDSSAKMELLAGRLTTAVPPEAVGFTVQTPSASIVDLGTEVGINVAADQQTHVEVFKGRAEVDATDASGGTPRDSRVLQSSMAVNVPATSGMIETVEPQPLVFVRQEQLVDRTNSGSGVSGPWQAFSHQLREDPSLIAYYTFDNGNESPLQLKNRAAATAGKFDGIIDQAAWDMGRFEGKQGLRFDGTNSQVALNIDGSFKQLTMATWVYIHAMPHRYNSLFGGVGQAGIFNWNLVPSGKPEIFLGVAGTGTRWSNYQFFAPELAKQATGWHFFAFGYDVEAGMVRCWMDDKLLPSANQHVPDPVKAPLLIGDAHIGNMQVAQEVRGFDGRMDELAIWNRSLSQEEIDAMYRAGMVR
jgi:hypothetical protein